MAPYRPIASKPVAIVDRSSKPLVQLNNRVVKQRRNHHTAVDWDSKKQTIIQLYATENKPAKEVIEILRSELAFSTSRRQLFNKLSEWEIQKNRKRDEEYIQGAADNHEEENEAVKPHGITLEMTNSASEPSLRDMGSSFLPDDCEMLGEINAQSRPATRGLLIAPPAHPPQNTSPSNHFQQFSEIPLEALDLRTPQMLSDDGATPSFLSCALSPRRPSTETGIRGQTPSVFGSHNQLPSENEDIFSTSPQALQETISLLGGNQAPRTPQISPSLENDICNIIKFVNGNERMINDSNGLQIKQDLISLLEFAQKGLFRTRCAFHNLGNEFSLVNNLISSAPTIFIDTNGSFRFPHYLLPNARNIEKWQERTTVRVGTTLLDISKKFSTEYPSQNDHVAKVPNNYKMYTCLKIVVKPKSSSFALQIEASQYPLVNSSFSGIPRLSIKSIVPSHSLGFKVAASGSVQELINLFASGQANIKDYDENGWSLLHHSLGNPQMCQFLVQSGLDVDESAWFWKDGSRKTRTPLHISYHHLKCAETFRILLAGGADPTIKEQGWTDVTSIIADSTDLEDFALLCDIFNLSAHFGVSNVRNGLGETVLLLTLCPTGKIYYDQPSYVDPVKKIEFILSRGGHIEDKSFGGLNCLHIFLRAPLGSEPIDYWLDGLIYAVRQGADVHCADMNGVTVSQIAYAQRLCLDSVQDFGSYRGDIWDSVLHACGYNILNFRAGFPRTARYTEYYTREDFESLWRNREHLCPYWDDTEWPALEPYQRVFDPSHDQKLLCCCRHEDAARWIDIDNNTNGCEYNGHDSESCKSSIDSELEYDADDENDEAERGEWEEEDGEAEIILQSVQDDQSSMYDTYGTGNNPNYMAMWSLSREPDGLFDATMFNSQNGWA
ncbi:hypothetical protein F4680DRAFT_416836 [Xylaria scruposa]|nr:hypothetical protein F4680DRAFT_416836 [Xylaria scruposa]